MSESLSLSLFIKIPRNRYVSHFRYNDSNSVWYSWFMIDTVNVLINAAKQIIVTIIFSFGLKLRVHIITVKVCPSIFIELSLFNWKIQHLGHIYRVEYYIEWRFFFYGNWMSATAIICRNRLIHIFKVVSLNWNSVMESLQYLFIKEETHVPFENTINKLYTKIKHEKVGVWADKRK